MKKKKKDYEINIKLNLNIVDFCSEIEYVEQRLDILIEKIRHLKELINS